MRFYFYFFMLASLSQIFLSDRFIKMYLLAKIGILRIVYYLLLLKRNKSHIFFTEILRVLEYWPKQIFIIRFYVFLFSRQIAIEFP